MTFTTFKPCTCDGKHISSQSDSDLDEVVLRGPGGLTMHPPKDPGQVYYWGPFFILKNIPLTTT